VDFLATLAPKTSEPQVINNRVAVNEYLRMLSSIVHTQFANNAQVLACYKLKPETFDAAYAIAAKACAADLEKQFPDGITVDSLTPTAKSNVACIRDDFMQKAGVNMQSLVSCINSAEDSTSHVVH
jgi:hypothetical protein